MLTRSMTAEWAAHGIQANAIGPGYMLTDMNEALVNNPEFNAWVIGAHARAALGRARRNWSAPPCSWPRAASDYVNGQIIYVDGGMLAAM